MATDWLIAIPALLHASGGASAGLGAGTGMEVALVVGVAGLGVAALPWRSGDHAAVAEAVGAAVGVAAALTARCASAPERLLRRLAGPPTRSAARARALAPVRAAAR